MSADRRVSFDLVEQIDGHRHEQQQPPHFAAFRKVSGGGQVIAAPVTSTAQGSCASE
jgi:hypothetical protein